jgi:Ricin-type beta-trefoil lectin domain
MKRMGKIAALLAAVTLGGGLAVGATGTARADTPAPGAWYEIYNPYTTAPACLDDPGGSTSVGTPIELWHCHGYDSQGTPQRWYFALIQTYGDGEALYRIRTQAGLCPGENLAFPPDGQRVVLKNCSVPYYWYLIPRNAYSGDPVFQLSVHGDLEANSCMTLPDLSGGNAEPVNLGPCGPAGGLQSYWRLG